MNVRVVFYSRKGTTQGLAKLVSDEVRGYGYETTSTTIQHVKRPGFFGASKTADWEKIPDIANAEEDFDLAPAEVIFIGGPVFNGRVTAYVKAFLEKASGIEGKPVGVFICCASPPDEGQKYVEELEELVKGYGLDVKARLVGSRKVRTEYPNLARDFVGEVLGQRYTEIGGDDGGDDDGGDGNGGDGNGE
jgi:flavodoxin